MDYPYLMSRDNFGYTYNTEAARKIGGEKFIPITAEQAADISKRGKVAGVEILRAAVAADNAAALRRAEAEIAAMGVEAAASPAPAPAEDAEPDRPWEAKPIKGNPPKKELIAFLLDKGVEDAESLPYDELKAVAATYDWVAEHGDK